MKVADFSVRRPVTIVMLVIAVILFGIVSFPKLSVDLFPEMELPVAVAVTSYPGATPTEVENLVTKPLEERLGTVSNLQDIYSISLEGASQVILFFNWGTDIDQAMLDMRDAIDQVVGMLPDDAKTPRVLKIDPNAQPIMYLSLSGDLELNELHSIAENVIKPRIERIDGIASLSIGGGQTREIKVILDQHKLEAYQLTINQIQQAIQAENFAGSAGSVFEGNQQLSIRVDGEIKDVDQLNDIPIRLATGETIKLEEVAEVIDGFSDMTQKTYVNGKPSLSLNITKATGGNTVKVAEAASRELEKIKEQLPEGVQLTTLVDTSEYINKSIATVMEHAILGGSIAVIVLFFFLGSVRSTIVAAISIPIALVATFCLMYFTGQTINMITLGGLTLGLGSLVDFAIVVLENVYRHRQEGKGLIEAATFGTKEVGNAVMAAALTQICVFVPIVFVEGLAAELFGPLALTVIYSHIAALLVAITLVPMMSSKLLVKVNSREEELARFSQFSLNPLTWFSKLFHRLSLIYEAFLRWALNWRKTVITVTFALLISALSLFPLIGAEFMPAMDQGLITINIEAPSGTRLEDTERIAQQVEAKVGEIPEAETIFTSIGGGGPINLGISTSHMASVNLILVPLEERERRVEEIAEELRESLKDIVGADISVNIESGLMGTGAPISVTIRGDNLAVLKDISEVFMAELEKIEGTRNITSDLQTTQNEFVITVDKEMAAQFGLGTHDVLSAVRTAFGGQTVTQYRTGDDEVDVRIMFDDSLREEITNLDRLMITSAMGRQIPLSMVAQVDKRDVPQAINRVNQTRAVEITSDVFGRDLGSISAEINQLIDRLQLPDGYTIEIGGQAQDMAESFASLGLAIIMAILLVYMVMAGQFESLFQPFIIMFSIPPTFIGVMVGLLVTGHKLSVSALIGIILLVGLVTNNAILLIDYTNTLRKRGVEKQEAILRAGPIRLRPILMTSITTIVALLPLAFGGGDGNEAMAPMAVVVIFGLLFSTLVTLILVPVVYSLFDDWVMKIKGWFTRKKDKPAVVEGNA